MAMGIFAVDDMAGIDVAWRVRQELGHFSDAGGRRPLVADKLYDLGRYGQKRGKGWYRYDESRKATPDPEVDRVDSLDGCGGGHPAAHVHRRGDRRALHLRARQRRRAHRRRRLERSVPPTSTSSTRTATDSRRGAAARCSTQTASVSAAILPRIQDYEQQLGPRWTPAPLLVELAASGRTFRDLDKSRSGEGL